MTSCKCHVSETVWILNMEDSVKIIKRNDPNVWHWA